MRLKSVLRNFGNRLLRRGAALLPLVATAVVLVGLLSVVSYVVLPLLPASYQHVLMLMRSGDWASSRVSLAEILQRYGSASTYVFLAAQVLQVIIGPIPGQIIALVGGYVFGFWQGLFLSMLGLGLGSLVMMGVGRIFGALVVRKLIAKQILARLDYLVEKGGLWQFFLLFLVPVLPDDTICLLGGLTRIPVWKLLLVCLLGRLPGMAILTFVGSSAGGNMRLAYSLLGLGVVGAAVAWLWSDELEAWVARLTTSMRRRSGVV